MLEIVLTVFGAILFFAAGAGAGYWFAIGGGKRKRAEEIQQEYDAYRDRVGNHFAQTAEHFRTIGREYRALYDHMSSGAEALCDSQAIDGRLAFAPVAPTGEDRAADAAESTNEAAEAAASPEASEEDDSTPDKRARDSGGESAPAEDETDALSEELAAENTPAADDPAPDADEKPAARPDVEIAAEETSASGDDRERTLH